ncbi:pyridoxal phosphate-dependent aminotransferase family protein [Actinomadura sp. NAK00032]|uniref:aminotransferase class I/II-fold pyridoxal phosphate-dependent enzyme n=1 Tax=Actinomadura sp. NAK00032 TaxID=2742128 RepID=UPI0015908F04|nr:pyridoxal phosphate-dependent aminotransferase family protein [Actinomadura sp. NAK00032]QKW38469.1 pyridoxal phosphate-dependent aminotransferase family protein [Actinomadura sp. NAK00032]
MAKWGFSDGVRMVREAGLMPADVPAIDGANGTVVHIAGRRFINFRCVDFLGWQHDEDVVAHFTDAARTYGLANGGSRAQAISRPLREIERQVCEIYGKESAITFASGMLATVGFVHAMTSKIQVTSTITADFSDVVFLMDRACHWSMWKAVEKMQPGRQLFSFGHNDVERLRTLLARHQGKRVIVGFQSVYSGDGSVAPIGAITDLCAEYDAVSYVDDANGFMVYDHETGPYTDEFRKLSQATFVMTSFTKAIGMVGGAIAGPADAAKVIEYFSGTSMFTAALQPPTASTIAHIIGRSREDRQRVDDYLSMVAWFREQLISVGCDLNDNPSYIISIHVGDERVAEVVRCELQEHGYLVSVFRYPAAERGKALLRIIPNLRHSKEHMEGLADTLKLLKGKYQF